MLQWCVLQRHHYEAYLSSRWGRSSSTTAATNSLCRYLPNRDGAVLLRSDTITPGSVTVTRCLICLLVEDDMPGMRLQSLSLASHGITAGDGDDAWHAQFRPFFHQAPQGRDQCVVGVVVERTSINHYCYTCSRSGGLWMCCSGRQQPRTRAPWTNFSSASSTSQRERNRQRGQRRVVCK